jgi:hypothetical protein
MGRHANQPDPSPQSPGQNRLEIEIFVGQGPAASLKRLGFLKLDNNERSSYQAKN